MEIQRSDIKFIIDRLNGLDVDHLDQPCIDSAINMLEELGNRMHKLQLENNSLKTRLKLFEFTTLETTRRAS